MPMVLRTRVTVSLGPPAPDKDEIDAPAEDRQRPPDPWTSSAVQIGAPCEKNPQFMVLLLSIQG